MPTSPRRRSTLRSPTSTCARSTRRRTPARNHRSRSISNRLGLAGAVLACAIAVAACGGGDTTPAPTSTVPTATAPSTGSDVAPTRDLVDLAARYRGLVDGPRSVALPAPAIGDVQSFNVLTFPANEAIPARDTVAAELRAISAHAYIFVEEGADVSDSNVDAATSVFEDEVWPAVTGAFGAPPSPGVDGDDRIVLLHADLGSAVGGYVSGEDAYTRVVVPTSNERELIYISLSLVGPGDPGWGQLVAHELQHLVHDGLDRDEASWVNEGLSEVAATLAGGGDGFYGAFLDRPDTQLNAWGQLASSAAHYGASSLFLTYLFEQTGGDPGELAARPENSVAGVRAFLDAIGADRDFESLVADWAVATLLDNPGSPYGYRDIDVGEPELSEPTDGVDNEVGQFATDYIELRADELPPSPTLVFQGDTKVDAVAATEGADGAFWWSGRGDNMDATLTREVDLTGLASATLTFRLWYDIERWFDYAYVSVSTDGGATWTALAGNETDDDDPLAVAYGPSYTGASDGWVDEEVDLSPYAGAPVLIRFEYITDDSTHAEGLAIDDIAIAEIGFLDNGEGDAGGWQRAGFRRVEAPLEQRFQLRLVTYGPGAPDVVELPLDADNRGEVDLTGVGIDYDRAVLVVVATTEGTTVPAGYRYELTSS